MNQCSRPSEDGNVAPDMSGFLGNLKNVRRKEQYKGRFALRTRQAPGSAARASSGPKLSIAAAAQARQSTLATEEDDGVAWTDLLDYVSAMHYSNESASKKKM